MADREHDLIVFGATSFVGQIMSRWLVERVGRLRPDLHVRTTVERGGGQHLVVLHA